MARHSRNRWSGYSEIFIGNQVLFWSTIFLSSVAFTRLFLHRWINTFLQLEPIKDAALFVKNFEYYLDNGWFDSVAMGSSPLFNLLGGIINTIISNPYLSLKTLNLMCLPAMIILWSLFLHKDLGVKGKLLFPSILLLLQVACIRHSFFSASNDGLFVFFLSLMFIFLYRGIVAKSSGVKMFAFAGFFMAASLSVRELLVFYMPGIAMALVLAFYLNKNKALGILSLSLTFILSLLLSGLTHDL